jgi:hypothetical protein
METPLLIYLACPYSHIDARVRQSRAHTATRVAAVLHDKGFVVYSPITHTAEIELYSMTRHSYEYWLSLDFVFLDKASWLYVLTLDGWGDSVGIQREIDRFHSQMSNKRGIRFIKPEDYGVKSCSFVGELQSALR